MSLIIILLMIVLLYEVSALGISPSTRKVYFEPNLEKTYYVNIINNEKKDMIVNLSVSGDMKECISFEKRSIEFKSYEHRKKVNYKLNLPSEMMPGIWNAEILIEEAGRPFVQGNIITATMSIASDISIVVVPEGKHIIGELKAKDTDKLGNLDFTIDLENIGSKDILKTNADIKIFSSDGSVIAILKTNIAGLKRNSKTLLRASAPVSTIENLKEGEYSAKASIYYDGLMIGSKDNFMVGEPSVNISIFAYDLGNQAYRFNFTASSNWNKKIEDIFIDLDVFDINGNAILSTRSSPFSIEPEKKSTLFLYGDMPLINGSLILVKVVFDDRIMQYEYMAEDLLVAPDDKIKKIEKIAIYKLILFIIALAFALIHVYFLYLYRIKKVNLKGRSKK